LERRQVPKVNAVHAARMLANAGAAYAEDEEDDARDAGEAEGASKPRGPAPNAMQDPRFARMFQEKQFEIDEDSNEYLALHPNAKLHTKVMTSLPAPTPPEPRTVVWMEPREMNHSVQGHTHNTILDVRTEKLWFLP